MGLHPPRGISMGLLPLGKISMGLLSCEGTRLVVWWCLEIRLMGLSLIGCAPTLRMGLRVGAVAIELQLGWLSGLWLAGGLVWLWKLRRQRHVRCHQKIHP